MDVYSGKIFDVYLLVDNDFLVKVVEGDVSDIDWVVKVVYDVF